MLYDHNATLPCHFQVLRSKALDIRNALLEALVSRAREQSTAIIAQYEAILTKIAEKPANEAELAALREFISDSKGQVHPTVLTLSASPPPIAPPSPPIAPPAVVINPTG